MLKRRSPGKVGSYGTRAPRSRGKTQKCYDVGAIIAIEINRHFGGRKGKTVPK